VAGSYTGTLVALGVVLWDRRDALFGAIDRELVGPLLRFGLPFMPSRVALWALNLSNRLLVGWLATGALAGVFVVAANTASAVALLVTAFQLAWPPFAYGIKDDEEARAVYRSVLTVWLLVALAVVLPLALGREWLMALLAGERYRGGADAMALSALGLAFYGAYYVVGVAVGRAKKTQLNWVVTGIAAVANVVLCIVLIPEYGAKGAGAASAIAYLLMAVLMVLRGGRVFPVRYDWPRLAALCALAAGLFALGELAFAPRGTGAVAGRLVVAALFVPLALSADRAARSSARRS
jgi:O-antigen/teichoic acid export membrane protein